MKIGYIRILPILIVVISFAGCKVGENYKRPKLDLPDSYIVERPDVTEDTLQIDSTTMATIEWRSFFKDSTLVSLIDYAISHNLDLQRSAQNIEINHQNFKQSKANFYPTLTASPAEYIKEYYSKNYYSAPSSRYYGNKTPPDNFYVQQQEYVSSLSSSWELDIWGKYKRQKESAKIGLLQSQELKKATQTALVAEVASTYYNLLMLNAQIEIARKNLALSDSTLTILKLQYDAGDVTALAVDQVASQKLKAKALIPKLQRSYSITENHLNSLLGRYPTHITIKQDLNEVNTTTDYTTGVPINLLRNRPDVIASEHALQIANAQVGIRQAMKYPSIKINASLGLDALWPGNWLDPIGSGFALLNGAIFQPIFQHRELKTNYKISLAEREIAKIDFKDKMLKAVNDVSDAVIAIEKLEEEYKIAQDQIKVAEKALKNASLLFNSGFANYLEVITAQENALDTELNLATLKVQLLIGNVNLYRNLGGGWK